MPDTVRIEIPEEHERDDVPDLLRHIAGQIEGGNREGYHPRWVLAMIEHVEVDPVVVACIAAHSHLVECDEDGYCNACGHQDGWDDENDDWLPAYKAVVAALTNEDQRDHRETLPGQPGYDTTYGKKIDAADAEARTTSARFKVTYTETRTGEVVVDADTDDEAAEMVERNRRLVTTFDPPEFHISAVQCLDDP